MKYRLTWSGVVCDVTCFVEADSEDELIRVQDLFRSQLLSIAPDLQPTF